MYISKSQMLKETLCFWKREYPVYKVLSIVKGQIVTPYRLVPVTSSLLEAEGELEIKYDWGTLAAFGGIIHTYREHPWSKEEHKIYNKGGFYVVKAYGKKEDLRVASSGLITFWIDTETAPKELGFTKIHLDEKDLFKLQQIAKESK